MKMIAPNPQPNTIRSPGPNDLIASLTGRHYLSWSQLNSYRGCPRRWFFSHVEGLKPDFVGSALLLGSAFHSAVQHHYEQQLIGRPTSSAELDDVFHRSWTDEAGDVNVRYAKGDDEQAAKDTGIRMLDAFLKSELATLPGSVIAIEETLTGSIHPEMPDLLMRLDVAWQDDDGLHLMDLKTSRSRWSEGKVNESSEQLLLYQLLATELAPDQPLSLHFGVISKARKPAVQMLDVPGDTTARSRDVVDLMLPVWNGIKAGIDFASPSPMCSGCAYKSKCPAFSRH